MSTEKEVKAPKEKPAEKAVRWHSPKGRIPRKVVRTFYDSKRDVVIDVVEVPKPVRTNFGRDESVVNLYVHVVSLNEDLQKKHCRRDKPVQVDLVVEVE